MISLVIDPTTSGIGAYSINTYCADALKANLDDHINGLLPKKLLDTGWYQSPELVIRLSRHICSIMDLASRSSERLKTQVYTFSSAEKAALQQYLINTALTTPRSTHSLKAIELNYAVKVCIGALCEGAALLETNYQPAILSGSLLDFLHKRKSLSREQLLRCLMRLGTDMPMHETSSVEQLRVALQEKIAELKDEGRRGQGGYRSKSALSPSPSYRGERGELGQLPRIVVLKHEIERVISLCVPGYWDLPEAATSLLSKRRKCPSDGDIYAIFLQSQKHLDLFSLIDALASRNKCMHDLLRNVRKRLHPLTTGGPELLVNEARPLTSRFMDICKVDELRKLFFMHQVCSLVEALRLCADDGAKFEVLSKLQNLWQSRIDGCPDATIG